jgi:type IV secretory pathway VirB2 component (pilin)
MGNIISIADRRGAKAQSEGHAHPARALSTGSMILLFTVVAVAMAAVAVLIGANSWDDAATLVVLISVIALLKLALANFMFFAMLKADEQVDRRIVQEPEPPPPPRRRAKVIVATPLAVRAKPLPAAAPRLAMVGRKALATGALDSIAEEK